MDLVSLFPIRTGEEACHTPLHHISALRNAVPAEIPGGRHAKAGPAWSCVLWLRRALQGGPFCSNGLPGTRQPFAGLCAKPPASCAGRKPPALPLV